MQDVIIGVCEFIGFGELFRAIAPPAACVLLVVGIVVSIVSLFVHRKEPKSPVEEFIDNRCVKFVNMLAMPDSDWLIQHTGTADV